MKEKGNILLTRHTACGKELSFCYSGRDREGKTESAIGTRTKGKRGAIACNRFIAANAVHDALPMIEPDNSFL
jgi:hypothetical protein